MEGMTKIFEADVSRYWICVDLRMDFVHWREDNYVGIDRSSILVRDAIRALFSKSNPSRCK
jgi:hypothetical protein